MSSRALRRLQAQSETLPTLPADDSGAEEIEEDISKPVKKRNKASKHIANPFELLTETSEGVNDDKHDTQEPETENITEHGSTVASSNKKKKRHKKNKKKVQDASRTFVSNLADKETQDEIEASIQEVNRILGEAGLSGAQDGGKEFTPNMKALLNIEYKNLNADNEMRKIFGARVVQADQGRARHRNRTSQKGGRLVQPKQNWPPVGRTGLSMSLVEGNKMSGGQLFTFEHNSQYQQVEFLFLDAVQSYNPQSIAHVVQDHPYHIHSLMQLSDIFRLSEDAQTAVDLIERAIYACECAFHPLFNIATGNCRLDFRRQENRAFYLLLFKHLTAVGQRGCSRTALEFCKVLLSLDPDGDPLCVLLMIDFYALRSEQYSFLIRMYEEWESFRNLSQLPNFAFSVPLAMFHLSKENESFAEKADLLLQDSLLMFPGLLMPLLDKCGVSPDKEVTDHKFFGALAQISQTPALRQLVVLYVGRCFSCWKEQDVLLWLETNVKATLQLVRSGDTRVNSYAEKRKVRYQGTPRNICRHFLISEIKDATAALPPELTSTPVLSYDPLPPLDDIVSYTRPQRTRSTTQPGENALSLFLRSLLPNFNAQPQDPNLAILPEGVMGGAVGRWGEEEEEEGAPNNELRRGVGALMDAMRDLLNNIRMAPPPVENGADQEEQGGNDDDHDDNNGGGEWD